MLVYSLMDVYLGRIERSVLLMLGRLYQRAHLMKLGFLGSRNKVQA